MPKQPEPCLYGQGTERATTRCLSPTACEMFGYCRERAVALRREAGIKEQNEWRRDAKNRAAAAAVPGRPGASSYEQMVYALKRIMRPGKCERSTRGIGTCFDPAYGLTVDRACDACIAWAALSGVLPVPR